MNWFDKLHIIALLIKVKLTWNRRNTHYAFTLPNAIIDHCLVENPKFMGPRDAVKLIPDGAVVATSGLAANQRPSILYWAIREVYEETGHPAKLTVVGTGGQGGRGRVPGTVEELGLAGLCVRLIAGHLETYKSILRLGDQGLAELQCIPQGLITFLFEAQGRGDDSILTHVGVDTFIDPRVGRGTPVGGTTSAQLVAVEDGKLRFRLPKIDVAVFNAYAADREGNIYLTHCPMQAEIREIAHAAKRNHGRVIANVARLVEKEAAEVFLAGEMVDAIVVYPKTEQSGYTPYHKQLDFLTRHSHMPIEEGIARARFVNQVMGITPRRSAVDGAIARLAASIFAAHVTEGAWVNIGVGLPEEVCRVIFDGGLFEHVTFFTESGVLGGLPAPGFFFGAAVGAEEIISSAETFRRCHERLHTAILGLLQADSEGNVNVSKRGEGTINYVGPGGFIDLTTAARNIIFATKWMERAHVRREAGNIRILKHGKPKFGSHVDEVTFSGKEALRAGKNVFYATTAGLFQLTARGMELIRVMPGIDIQKDIIEATSMDVVLPASGQIPLVDAAIVTGKGFVLKPPCERRERLP